MMLSLSLFPVFHEHLDTSSDNRKCMPNQRELLIHHFNTTDTISGVEAASIYKIRSLPRRIMDLKVMGYEFTSEWRKDPTGQRYKRYSLVSTPESR